MGMDKAALITAHIYGTIVEAEDYPHSVMHQGVTFMCKAMEEMRNDTKIKTVIQLGKLKNLSNDQIIEDLVAVCNVTKENAMKILGVQPA